MVGSMVQFRDGKPDKSNYRRFKIRTVEGIDDFASIAEVVKRRYQRLLDEHAPFPDLVIIDGGKGQLSSARGALCGLGVTSQPVIAIAKREEEVYVPDTDLPLLLDKKSIALRFMEKDPGRGTRFAIVTTAAQEKESTHLTIHPMQCRMKNLPEVKSI